jgi:undecaprenyl-diphosphatase
MSERQPRHRGRARGAWGAAVLLAVVAALPVDAVIHDLAFRHVVTHEVRLVANGFTQLGTTWAAGGLLAALGIAGHRAADAALARAGAAGLVGLAVGGVANQVAKHLVCRGRPGLEDGWGVDRPEAPGLDGGGRAAARRFFHWPCLGDSRFQSFPSGHATTAFTVAAVLTWAAPARWRLWLGVAAGIGLSRVLLNAHFISDVLGGAAIGWWAGRSGRWLVERYAPASARPAAWPGAGEGEPERRVPSR